MSSSNKLLLTCFTLLGISSVLICVITFALYFFLELEPSYSWSSEDVVTQPAPEEITSTPGITPFSTNVPIPTEHAPFPIFPGIDGNSGSPGISQRDRDRPYLSGPMKTHDSENFRVHYTISGTDAVSALDENQNDIPDYVEEVSVTMEFIWDVAIDYYRWAAPPPDGDLGGDDRYDVYIQFIFDELSGYTDGGNKDTFIGDNPNSNIVEERSSHSFLVLDIAYADIEGEADYSPLEYMRSTAAHEFAHAIQFGYDGEEPAEWLWEATANWMQDQIFDDINDANEDLGSVFKSPDSCQISEGGTQRLEDSNHWYGMWIFIRYIAEHYGQETIRYIWEHTVNLDGYEAVESALVQSGTSLDSVIQGFGVALLTRDFEEGQDYPTVRLEDTLSPGQSFHQPDGVAQMGMDFIEIRADEIITVSIDASELSGLLIGQVENTINLFYMPEQRLSIDPADFENLYLMVLNNEKARNESDCYAIEYRINVETGGVSQSPDEVHEVQYFLIPSVEKIINVQDWIPANLPHGYVYDHGFLGDFSIFYEEDLRWFMPDAEIAYVLEFNGPNDGYLAVTLSLSAYNNLGEWLTELNYVPQEGELQTINQTEVLVSDWSDGGMYSYVAYLQDGYFIALDGTISQEELSLVAESLITR